MAAPITATECIVGKLLADAGVTALVSTRIYPGLPTQDPANDYIVVTKTAGGNDQLLNGNMQINKYTMRVDCYAMTEARAEAILKAANVPLSGWKDRTVGVLGCFNVADSDEQVTDDLGGGVYRVSGQSFTLFFRG